MTLYTYDGVPSGIDFGDIAVGIPSTQKCVVKYLPVDPNATTVANEVFYIQDNGSLARDWVLLSSDQVNFYNQIKVATFKADQYVTLWIKVNPTGSTYMTQEYDIELRSTVNTNFVLPIHFRITGARLCTPNDVRSVLQSIGKQRQTISIAGSEFDNLAGWTQIAGTWAVANNSVSVSGVTTGEGLLIYSAPFVTNYEETVNLTLTAGKAGLVFGYSDANNFYAVMFDVSNNQASLIQKVAGVTTTLKTVSQTMTVGATYLVQAQMTDQGVLGVWFDTTQIFNYSFGSTITGQPGLRAISTPTVVFSSWYLNTENYAISDADINDYIKAGEAHIFNRTRKLYEQKVMREVYDYRDQLAPEMPYVMTRSFNTLPAWDMRRITKDYSLQLRLKPVINVISLEENVAADGASDSWQVRSQGRDGDYVIYPDEGLIVWINNLPHNGHQNIRVTYAYGNPNVPENVRRYCAVLAAQMVIVGYGSPASGIAAMQKELRMQRLELETYIPQATILGSPGGTGGPSGQAGQADVAVV
jgi:hypothetical protein